MFVETYCITLRLAAPKQNVQQCMGLVTQLMGSLNSCDENQRLTAALALRGPTKPMGFSSLLSKSVPTVTYLPEATTVLAHRVFSMLRLSFTGGSPSS